MKWHALSARRQIGLLVILGATAFGSVGSEAAVRRALLSVTGLHVTSAESIYDFRIDTWGVEFLAVCTLPQSWKLTSEKFENSEGYLSGMADLHGAWLRRLSQMYLVDVYDYQPNTVHEGNIELPASFKGWARIGSREQFGGWHGRRIILSASNFHLETATGCPTPPPAAP